MLVRGERVGLFWCGERERQRERDGVVLHRWAFRSEGKGR